RQAAGSQISRSCRRDTKSRAECLAGRRSLRSYDASERGRQQTNISAIQKVQRGEGGNTWEVTSLFVIAEEEERLVLDDWPTDGAAELIAHVLGLESYRRKHSGDVLSDKAARVAGSPFVVAVIKERATVKLIGA